MKTGLNYHRLILLTGLLSSLTPERGVHGCLCLLNHPLPHKHPHCNTIFFPLQKCITFERNNGSNYLSTREQESNSSVVNKIARIHAVSGVIHMEYEEVETGHKPCGAVCGINQQAWGYA